MAKQARVRRSWKKVTNHKINKAVKRFLHKAKNAVVLSRARLRAEAIGSVQPK